MTAVRVSLTHMAARNPFILGPPKVSTPASDGLLRVVAGQDV